MSTQRLTTAFLNNLKPNPANAKSTDYEVNLSAMKDSGLPTGVRCLVGKSGNKRFLLRYISPVTSKKASIDLGKHPETDILTLRKIAKEYRQQILEGIDPSKGDVLELKHQATQLIGAKTRAQYTVIESEGYEPILAKGGVKVDPMEPDQSAYMVNKYLERQPDDKVDGSYLTPNRIRFLEHKDLMLEKRSIFLNMEYDQKRELVNPKMLDVKGKQHIALETVPHQSLDSMLFTRIRFDHWRKNHCLKYMDDWYDWQERLSMYKANEKREIRLKKAEKSDELMVRLFVRFYGHEVCGISKKDITAKALSDWLVGLGYDIKPSLIRGAGPNRAKLVEGAVPVTDSTLKLANLLVGKFPQFDPVPPVKTLCVN